MAVEAYTVILPKPVAEKLKQIADRYGLTINDVFAMAIKELLEKEEKREGKRRGVRA
ncbi:MAG: hypothetical protein J7K15_10215 [Deltaproteobacteria bacterium]|nr:hypothetical protein [Deltaproteobacteria bacterium]